MAITIRAHFDGKVIVPDEPVDLPIDQLLEIKLESLSDTHGYAHDELTIEERLERLARATGRIPGPSIPLEALRRENLYEDR